MMLECHRSWSTGATRRSVRCNHCGGTVRIRSGLWTTVPDRLRRGASPDERV